MIRASDQPVNYMADNVDEVMLTRIWCRHLRLAKINRNDDFFAIGGTSLQAVQVFSEIEEATGLELPITVLFDAPTIGELAKYIQQSRDTGNRSLVLLQAGDDREPLFLIHPVGGTVLVYRELVEAMNVPGPVYGIQAVGLIDDQQPHTSVEEMAEYYCDQVLTAQPIGPCLLAGYSSGGIIAFAMAQRLLRMGREVGFLGLINTHYIFRRTGQQIGFFNRLPAYVRYSRDRKFIQAIRDFFKYLRHQRKLITAEGMLDAKGMTFEERRQKLIGQILQEKKLSRGDPYSVIQQLQQIAIRFYQPSSYSGTICLYKTADYHDNRPGEIGWERLAAGGINLTPIPGTHLSLVQDDNAVALASILSGDLRSINVG